MSSPTISTDVTLDAALLERLSNPELAELAIQALKIVAQRFTEADRFFAAKSILAVQTQLVARARPYHNETIRELTEPTPSPPSP